MENNPISEYEAIVDHVYGVYLDSTTAFKQLHDWFQREQLQSLDDLRLTHPDLANMEYLDSSHMIYGKGDPNQPDSVVLHKCTQKQYKERNTSTGSNYRFIGNMALVTLYQYWEDNYRQKIAVALGRDRKGLTHPIMGDLAKLRRSIIHHSGIALKQVEKCEVLKWFNEGDDIFIDKGKFEEIIFRIKSMLRELNPTS